MANRLNISWPRILAEGTAIVVSILLAFWIQAWWEGLQQENRELELIAQLDEEIQGNKVLFDTYRGLHI